jgi:hypothetical protein
MAEREKEKRHRGPVLVFSAKGSRKNNFPEFTYGFVADWGELKEHNRSVAKPTLRIVRVKIGPR